MRDFILDKYRLFKEMSWKKKTVLIGGVTAVVLIVIPLGTYAYFARDISNSERLMNRKNTGVVLLDKEGVEFFRTYNASSGERIGIKEIPEHAQEALIATEDRNFHEHNGYSIRSIVAALYANVLNRDSTRYGGSTLTQQLVKNALLTSDKNYLRKYQELALAIAVERNYTKDEILEMYLNSVYFGEGAFGIEDAAQAYFGKSAKELSRAETSLLVGILPAPSALSPLTGDLEGAKERQEVVLTSMVEVDYIDEDEKTAILAEELALDPVIEETDSFAQHYALMVMDELQERYGEEKIARSGFRVTTALDISWQQEAEAAVADHIAQIKYSGAHNGSLVAIDPNNGEIRALVGSVDWNNEEFGKVNMANTPRQPGSSFKPIYYTEALAEKVITPATVLKDAPTTFGTNYTPENYDFRYRGDITVRRALGNSLNIPAVKVMEKLGVNESVEAAKRLGLSTVDDPDSYGLSLALGTAEVPLLDMTNAYAAFANAGDQYEPVMVRTIHNKYNKQIHKSKPKPKRVINNGAAFLISSILSDDSARAETFGGSLSIGRPAAVKTGTTEENRDAWTIGYTPSVVVGVWVGNNLNETMNGIGGSSGAGPIWNRVMQSYLEGKPAEEFRQPSNVESVLLCPGGTLRAKEAFPGTFTEYFLRGTAPSGSCATPAPPPPPPEPEPEKKPEEEEEPEEEDPPPEEEEEGPPPEEEEEDPPPEDEEETTG